MRPWLVALLLPACQTDTSLKTPDAGCPTITGYVDADGDGVGAGDPVERCEDEVLVTDGGDCDDGDATITPGAIELCDGIDQDCDDDIDEELTRRTWYRDVDGDGFGGEAVQACRQPAATLEDGGDCDDAAATIFPGADELCNGVDDDCDTRIDEDAIDADLWYRDGDGDGFGVDGATYAHCGQPLGGADNTLDCDDADPLVTDACPPVVQPPNPPGPPANPPPAGVASCAGGQLYGFQQVTGQPELVIVGVYEPTATDRIDVYVTRPTQLTLLLSSYEEVDWHLHVDPAVQLQGVLINGYDAQRVNGVPAGVQTLTRTFAQTGTNFGYWCGYSWPYNGGGCDTNLLVSGTEAFTGLTTTTFIGCYTGQAFQVQ